MGKFLILGSLIAVAAATWAEPNPSQTLYQACRERIDRPGGFGSPDWQYRCEENFDMIRPDLLRCLKFVRDGFPKNDPKEIDLKTCKILCENNTKWGPWFDYELDNSLKDIFFEMKRRHDRGRCLED